MSTCDCKICGGTTLEFWRSTLRFRNQTFPCKYYQCDRCGFQFSTAFDHFTKQDFEYFYSYPEYLQIDEWARMEYEGLGPGRVQIQLDSFKYALKLLTKFPFRVLVFGNGACRLPLRLRQLGVECYVMSPYGRELSEFNLPLASLENFLAYFNCIICAEVFEHFVNPLKEFANIIKYLQPAGWLVGTTGAVEYYRCVRPDNPSYYLTENPNNGHTSFFTRESIALIASHLRLKDATIRAALSGHDSRKWRIAFSVESNTHDD